MGMRALGPLLVFAILLSATASQSQTRDPDVTRRLSEALDASLDKAKYEHKRKAALLQDIADAGWSGFPMAKDDADWRRALDPEVYAIARQKRDRMRASSEHLHIEAPGALACGACGAPLFEAEAWVESAEPGLHFARPQSPASVVTDRHSEWSLEHGAVELLCGSCGAHLGHVDPGQHQDQPLRFVINPPMLSRPDTSPPTDH